MQKVAGHSKCFGIVDMLFFYQSSWGSYAETCSYNELK